MKRYTLFILLTAIAFCLWRALDSRKPQPAVLALKESVGRQIDSLYAWAETDFLPLAAKGSEKELQASLARGRNRYKGVEWAVEYFFPATARELNGPPLPEIEAEEHIILPPAGFAMLEEDIYPLEETHRAALVAEARKVRSLLHRLQTLWGGVVLRDDHLWSALRLQLMRLMALGLPG
ncbi:MAG TPA: hypothetical protein VHK69_03260, partial [Chitinophagaceae bacterium]|nr:hypothetical protein [Chitinophagaceae bacterium]